MADMADSGDFDPGDDFYEDDEPLQDVLAAYERGIKGVTARPLTLEMASPDAVVIEMSSRTAPARVHYEPTTPVQVRAAQVRVS